MSTRADTASRSVGGSQQTKEKRATGGRRDEVQIQKEILAAINGLREDLRKYFDAALGGIPAKLISQQDPSLDISLDALPPQIAQTPKEEMSDGTNESADHRWPEGGGDQGGPKPGGEKDAQEQPSWEDQVRSTHKWVVDHGAAKREHKHIEVLEWAHDVIERRAKEAHADESDAIVRPIDYSGNESVRRKIGDIFHDLHAVKCVEPVGKPVPLTDAMRNIGRKKDPVREWKLTNLGVSVVRLQKHPEAERGIGLPGDDEMEDSGRSGERD